MTELLLVQVVAAAAMTGLIWFVQIVHYPLFVAVGADAFAAYETAHQRLTGYVVAPIMAVEMATAVGGLAIDWPSGLETTTVVAFGLLLVIWLSTAFVQIPCHHRLSTGFDADVHRRLVATNWIRTIAWTARSGLLGMALLAG